jgi:phage shock protein E
MKRFLLAVALLGAVCGRALAADAVPHPTTTPPAVHSAGGFKNVGVQAFEKLRQDKNSVVLDVRTPKEYAAGHVPGAINIDVTSPDFEKKVKALDPEKTYLVHCAGGRRGSQACGKLSQLSFEHLYNLEGGFNAWQKAGNQAER